MLLWSRGVTGDFLCVCQTASPPSPRSYTCCRCCSVAAAAAAAAVYVQCTFVAQTPRQSVFSSSVSCNHTQSVRTDHKQQQITNYVYIVTSNRSG